MYILSVQESSILREKLWKLVFSSGYVSETDLIHHPSYVNHVINREYGTRVDDIEIKFPSRNHYLLFRIEYGL